MQACARPAAPAHDFAVAGTPGRRARSPCSCRRSSGHRRPAISSHLARALKIVDRRIPMLLQGETGTGKEAFALAVHRGSLRASQAFVAVNCAAIPDTLIESELFGYAEGAFTGAKRKGLKGKILRAHGGTLFLDEIGDMALPLQTGLLRVPAESELVPLGSEQSVRVDINLICATHRDLARMVPTVPSGKISTIA